MYKTKKILLLLITSIVIIPFCIVNFGMKTETNAAATLYWPVPGHHNLSQGYHDGNAIDISDGSIGGANVIAAIGGTVCTIYKCGSQHYGSMHDCNGFGTGIAIHGDDGRTYQYAHMQADSMPSYVYYGARIEGGQVIGRVGTTGNSSGNHLHFGISNSQNYWESGPNPANESYRPDGDTVSVSWADSDKQVVNKNRVYVHKKASLSGATMNDMSSVGINVYNSSGTKIGSKSETPDRSGGSYVYIWYDFKDELGINIQRGATYEFQLYAIVKGKTYNSPRYKVTVPGGTPTIPPTATPTATPTVKPTVPTVTATPTEKPAEPTAATVPTTKPTAVPTEAPARYDPDEPIDLDFGEIKSMVVVCGEKYELFLDTDYSIRWKSSDSNVVKVDKNGKITANQAGNATITATANGKNAKCTIQVLYKDVKNSTRFWYEPTNYLTNLGVVKGYAKQTEFRPANECTRAQMVTFIWRLEGCPEPESTKCKFSDVKSNNYFYKACIWGNENHIVEGYKDGTFGPQIICARKHAVTFLWRLAGKPDPESTENVFKDVKEKDYFYTATLWASEKGILAGYKDHTFRPNGDCLRRQMVTFLYKYDKFINGNG
ncbi:MAG: S-layer homology domain-containing protein [Clostridiales bacterium]|nr:S-layer homology domain-containing protein [Clostridiales bacterium]